MTPDPHQQARRELRRAERLVGLVLILASVAGFGLVYLLWWIGPLSPPAPRGLPPGLVPMLNPVSCLIPGAAIGSCILFLLGVRRLLFPD
jgi:hypothetical protein